VTLPVFDTGEAAIRRAEAEYRAGLARWTAQAREVEQQVRGAWSTATAARAASELARGELVQRAERTAELAERAHAAGDAPYSTRLAAEQGLVRARQAVLAAEVEAARARAALERAAGVPWNLLAPETPR
jgi:outer membrane protein TolC